MAFLCLLKPFIMYRHLLALLLLCIGMVAVAQPSSIPDLLKDVQSNNAQLQAFRAQMRSQKLAQLTENQLPDLQFSAYYLPFGEHAPGDYTEFEVSQRMEFPSVYKARSEWIAQEQQRLAAEYSQLRQSVLLKAKKEALQLIYLQRKQALLDRRIQQAQQVYEQIQLSFEKGQTGKLDLNKAQILWLDQQFAQEELQNQIALSQERLSALNGGELLRPKLARYPDSLPLPPSDSLWNRRLVADAQLLLVQQEQKVWEKNIQLQRNKRWPDLIAGANYQGVVGNNYFGFYAGLSIPLWKAPKQLAQAEAQLNYHLRHQNQRYLNWRSTQQQLYQGYKLLLRRFEAYQQALAGLDSELLLQKSYTLGEISFLAYYQETAFYREAEDRLLDMEKEVQLIKAELLKHQL